MLIWRSDFYQLVLVVIEIPPVQHVGQGVGDPQSKGVLSLLQLAAVDEQR